MDAAHEHDWIGVNYEEVDEATSHVSQGSRVKITFRLSPMDVPSAWRYKVSDGFAYIEFRYLSMNEPTRTVRYGKDVSFEIGKNSLKVYKMTVSIKVLGSGINVAKTEIGMGILAGKATESLTKRGALREGNASAIMNLFKPTLGFDHSFA